MNVHISSCRLGETSDVFDKHVFSCNNGQVGPEGPFFKAWILMELDNTQKLLTYENHLQKCGYDTINYGKPE